MNEDYGADLAALKEQLAQISAERAAQKRDSFIDGESSYFGGDRTVTGEIFDRLEQMAPGQLSAMDLAARSGMYEAARDQLNQLSQKLSMAVDNMQAKLNEVQAEASQVQAEAQQKVADMQNTVQALQTETSTESGAPEQVSLDASAGLPPEAPAPEMSAPGATPAGEAPAPEMPAPEAAPAGEAPASEMPAPEAAPAEGELPPLPEGPAVSDERLKDVKGERKLGGESHKTPNKLGGEGMRAKVDAWRKTRQVQCTSKECATTKHSHAVAAGAAAAVSDARMKTSFKPTFSSSMIAACRVGR